MIVIWILGIVLCLFNLWLLKNSETIEFIEEPKPVLKMWMVLIIVLCMIIPGSGLALGILLSVIVCTAYPCRIIKWKESKPFTETKLGKFLYHKLLSDEQYKR